MNVEGGDPFLQAQEETFEIQIRDSEIYPAIEPAVNWYIKSVYSVCLPIF